MAEASRRARITEARASGELRYWQSEGGAGLWLRYAAPGWREADRIVAEPLEGLIGVTPVHAGKSAAELWVVDSEPISARDVHGRQARILLPADARSQAPIEIVADAAPGLCGPDDPPSCQRLQLMLFATQVVSYAGLSDLFDRVPPRRLVSPGAVVAAVPAEVAGRVNATEGRTVSMVCGLVRDVRLLINPLTGRSYVWALVTSERGNFDILAAPAMLHGTFEPGRLVQAMGFLVAQPAPDQERISLTETLKASPPAATEPAHLGRRVR
ncbi:MAG: hypothetical protein KGP27_01100 [Hyphomicrobiales bacterium]|nr:hypothetical protein [Hyphomicrobiales bacterium]